MEKRKPSLYSLSKYPNLEIVLDSQLASAGAHQAKVLEKCERNQKYIKSQTNSLKVVSAFIMLFVPFMFFIIYMNLIEDYDLSTFSTESTLIIFTSFLSIFLILTLIYTFLFGLFTTSSLMSGTSFKWLQTLPLSKGDLRKLGFMTLFRSLNISSILMIIAFPIMLLFLTQNIFTFLLSFVSSFLNTMFCISLLIIIGQKFSNLFSEQVRKSSRASILRVISLISYFIIAFSSGFIMSLGIIIIDNLIGILGTSGTSDILIMIFTLIPFPFAPSSLVALTLIDGAVPITIWLSSIIGTVIFALLIFGMYKAAIKSLRNITSSEFGYSGKKEIKKKSIDIIELDVKPSSPIRAYIKKDLVASFKDYQSLIFILMPLIYPLIMIFSLGAVISQNVSSSLSIMILWAFIMLFNIVIPIILVMGLLNLEESGSSIMASLPIVP
ncbi:MAG: hypothetical protein ACFFKA_02260, partial [Candidatus Thorarchaeota archaeon]